MRYTNIHDKIVELCSTAITLTEVEAKLGITSPSGGLRNYVKLHKIPMPLYEGKRAASRLSQAGRKKITLADLTVNTLINRATVKRLLFREGLKEERCEECGWNKRRADGLCPLHLHHVSGDGSDNRIENLQILCPSCHSLTPNYSGKNQNNPRRSKEHKANVAYYSAPKHTCEVCGKLGYGETYCSSQCAHLATRRTEWPTKEQLEQEIKMMSWTAIGRKYGVSDNAVRKWAKNYSLL